VVSALMLMNHIKDEPESWPSGSGRSINRLSAGHSLREVIGNSGHDS
jgi:hypothetical protein